MTLGNILHTLKGEVFFQNIKGNYLGCLTQFNKNILNKYVVSIETLNDSLLITLI